MQITQIFNDAEKQQIARNILEALPEWFGIETAKEEYIADAAGRIFFCAENVKDPIGFIYLKPTGKDTIELAVMGIKKQYHRNGIGRALFQSAKEAAQKEGFSFLQVKTVKMGMYPEYDRTNLFYLSLGFREFEVFPMLWDENNPCQIYVMSLSKE